MGREATDASHLYRHCGPRMRVAFSLVRVRRVDDGVGDIHRHPSAWAGGPAVPQRRRRRPEKAACLLIGAQLSATCPRVFSSQCLQKTKVSGTISSSPRALRDACTLTM